MKQISDLRYHNHKELTKYWNTENIQAMEIVMMETEGCAGTRYTSGTIHTGRGVVLEIFRE